MCGGGNERLRENAINETNDDSGSCIACGCVCGQSRTSYAV